MQRTDLDTALFSPLSHAERAATRAHLGIGADEVVLLNVSDATPEAGIDLLLQAFARLRRAGLGVRLVLRLEHATGEAGYDAVIRTAAAAEPCLLSSETLAAITVLPGVLERSRLRLLYGMADCTVSPHRTAGFAAPVFESICTGTPAVVTGGGASDLCDDDTVWRIPGRLPQGERPADVETGPFIEPDLDALTDALAAVAQGRGFDRLRFAQGRMRLLRGWASRRGAMDPAERVTGTAVEEDKTVAAAARSLSGLAQPTGFRFAALRSSGLQTERRGASSALHCRSWCELAIVVQGPCLRSGTPGGAPSIDDALVSIRRHFPGAQIVVSTWFGSDIAGLDADEIVLGPDPGPLDDGVNKTNNVNRVVTSTGNGLAAVTRPFSIKTRNDILFHSAALPRKPLRRAAPCVSLERRIWVEANRIETSLRPFHPSDIIQYGLTDDLRRLWDVPPVTWDESFIPDAPEHLMRHACEQSIFLGYLRGLGVDHRLHHTFDERQEIIAASVASMLDCFDVFEAERIGVALPSKFRANPARIRLMETEDSFDVLRQAFASDPTAACVRVIEARQATFDGLRR